MSPHTVVYLRTTHALISSMIDGWDLVKEKGLDGEADGTVLNGNGFIATINRTSMSAV
jgi:hypothetical protein